MLNSASYRNSLIFQSASTELFDSDAEALAHWKASDSTELLYGVDQGITYLVQLVEQLSLTRSARVIEGLLDDIECASCTLVFDLQRMVSLSPSARVELPVSAAEILIAAVAQYVTHMPTSAHFAIRAGVEAAEACKTVVQPTENLSADELQYRAWAVNRLIEHLIF